MQYGPIKIEHFNKRHVKMFVIGRRYFDENEYRPINQYHCVYVTRAQPMPDTTLCWLLLYLLMWKSFSRWRHPNPTTGFSNE